MKPSSPNKLNTQIYSEASDWLVEFRSGDVDAAGRKEFYHWLRTSPEHMRAYLELAAIWNEGSRLDPNHRFDDEDLLQQARSEGNVVPLTEFESPQRSELTTAQLPTEEPQLPTPWAHLMKETLPHSPFRVRGEGRRGEVPSEGEALINSPSPRERRGGRGVRVFAVAASVLAVVLTGSWLYTQRNTYATGIGEQRSLALADGSTVELNAHSKIRVRFTADRRTIDLVQGQALFRVAKDKTRPFIVQSDDTKVRAVGTEFDVYRRMTGTTVTVIEGRVAVLPPSPSTLSTLGESGEPRNGKGEVLPAPLVSTQSMPDPMGARRTEQSVSSRVDGEGSNLPSPRERRGARGEGPQEESRGSGKGGTLPGDGPVANAGEFLLAAGEQAILTAQATVKPKQPDIAAATAWTQRHLVFQSATLREVAEEFNRYNARQLVIKDPELADFHITGVFASTDPASLIRFLQARPGIVVTEKSDEILITRKL